MSTTSVLIPLKVRYYDLDVREQVPCSTLFRYLEEAAIRGSAHFGFTHKWYRERRQFWVIRTLQLERRCAVQYPDELEIRTWVSSMARVRSDRNYEIRRAGDSHILAKAIANWVFLDANTLLPTKIPPEIADIFSPDEPPALPPVGKVVLDTSVPAEFEFRTRRQAQFYEADSAQHVNNAVYVDWIEEAVRNALSAMGFNHTVAGTLPLPWFRSHTIEYVRPAVPPDEVEIQVQLLKRGNTRGEWQIEIIHAGSTNTILRARTTTLWIDATNRPVRWTAPKNF